MTQATVFKSAGACTDTSLPILYRDPAITPGTIFLMDALDPSSWPKQSAPLSTDSINSLTDSGVATFTGAPGWAGGFVFSSGGTASINLPTTSKFGSDHASGFLFSIWCKPAEVTALVGVAGISNGTPSTCQYLIYKDSATPVFGANAGSMPSGPSLAAGAVVQLVIAYDGDGVGNYARSTWKNGVQLSYTAGLAAASLYQPAPSRCEIGKASGLSSFNGVVYRCMLDQLTSSKTVAEIVAADYAAGVGRFS